MDIDKQDDFFSPLENVRPYLKAAFQGFAGSGKSHTMAALAIGLYRRIGSQKPIVLFDTEEAGKFLLPHFKKNGIAVLHKRSRSLADWQQTIKRCRDGAADILLLDSGTHIWENFVEAYRQKKRGGGRLQFEDWGFLKPTWKQEFSEPYVRDPYHVIMTGRAGFEYEDEKDENGKRQIYKSGVKMKMETETAYEPDLLVYMERHEMLLEDQKQIWREATVIKDRSTLIDGKTFKNPTFEDFEPAVSVILTDASTRASGPEGDASTLIQTEEDKRAWLKRRDIALEEIEGLLIKAFPGTSGPAKAAKSDALQHCFDTRSWTKVASLPTEIVEGSVDVLKRWLTAQQSASEAAS